MRLLKPSGKQAPAKRLPGVKWNQAFDFLRDFNLGALQRDRLLALFDEARARGKTFAQSVGVTSIFLTKLDGTAKGGIVFSICDQLHIPVRFIGTGERAADVALFDPAEFVDALFA